MARGWSVERVAGRPSELHARPLPDEPARAVTFLDATAGAVVLGTAQRDDTVDAGRAAAAGLEVVRRRSGGGAVLVRPGELVWADVVLPADDELWDADVGRAFHWLGDAWAAALADLGVEAHVHRGGLARDPWLRRVCFAGRGPGEVTVDGRKVVGLSQRRTRRGAVFQCAALLAWEPGALLDVLALTAAERAEGAARLAGVAAALPVSAGALETALLAHLP